MEEQLQHTRKRDLLLAVPFLPLIPQDPALPGPRVEAWQQIGPRAVKKGQQA